MRRAHGCGREVYRDREALRESATPTWRPEGAVDGIGREFEHKQTKVAKNSWAHLGDLRSRREGAGGDPAPNCGRAGRAGAETTAVKIFRLERAFAFLS